MTQQRSSLDVADWVRRFKADPIEVLQARDEWLVIATAHVEDPGVSDIAPDFVGLTRLLVAWADQTGVDGAGSLRDLCRQLCAMREPGPPWGHPGVSESGLVGWEVRRRIIEDLMAQAIGVVERITDAAIVRAKTPSPLTGKPLKAAEHIKEHCGEAGDAIALAINITPEGFRRIFCEKLRPRGFYNEGGYFPPDMM